MKERPILFSAPMVRAILDGTKTQTRRVVKLDHFGQSGLAGFDFTFAKRGRWHEVRLSDMINPPTRTFPGACPYGTIGDRLWVRETWCQDVDQITLEPIDGTYLYAATQDGDVIVDDGDGYAVINKDGTERSPWRSPIFMPRRASRITLEITGIRVERVRDITRDDAMEEGVERVDPYSITPDLPPGMPACWKDYAGKGWLTSPMASFRTLWDSINAKSHPWASNPWVWVIEFGRLK
jgi:hypothetical protein